MGRKFAYGRNEIDNCGCPVKASGREVNGLRLDLADMFDRKVANRLDENYGFVSEDVAKEVWEEIIHELEVELKQGEVDVHPGVARSRIAEAEEIAHTVF
jgi:hypothetical protein